MNYSRISAEIKAQANTMGLVGEGYTEALMVELGLKK